MEPVTSAGQSQSPAEPSRTVSPTGQSSPENIQNDDHNDGSRFAFTKTIRRMSKTFEESDIPPGFMAATGGIASSAVNPPRRRSSAMETESPNSRQPSVSNTTSNDRACNLHRISSTLASPGPTPSATLADVAEHPIAPSEPIESTELVEQTPPATQETVMSGSEQGEPEPLKTMLNRSDTAAFENGYHFPPSYTAWESTKHFSIVLWRYFCTPIGFIVVIYGLNVVAWGGMLFLLLCNAAPAMCHPTCNDIQSPRRKWMEVDQQIINALFCVTGFGFAPWRTRDLWYLMQFRISKKYIGLQRLAGIYNSWFRLPGSEQLPIDVGPENINDWPVDIDRATIPFPPESIARSPLTGVRASPTKTWKIDALVWLNFANTIFQVLLAYFMWAMNRYDRPSWVTGFLVSMGIVSAIVGGLVIFFEGKRVKNIEGVPLTDRDIEKLKRDKELGISHYNNLSDKKPKGHKAKASK